MTVIWPYLREESQDMVTLGVRICKDVEEDCVRAAAGIRAL